MLNLKPLFLKRILLINPQLGFYCKDCWATQLQKQNKIVRAFKKIETKVINDLNDNVKFILDAKKNIIIKGVPNYIGNEVLQFTVLPKFIKDYKKQTPHTFNSMEIKKLALWKPILIPIFEDLILQKYSILNSDISYITNRRIESDIIKHLEDDKEKISREKVIIDGLMHRLPFIENVTLNTLLKVRDQEAEAFTVYRDAVKSAIKKTCKETDEEVVKNIVDENIRPQLNKLDQIMRNHKNDFKARGKREIIWSGLLLTAGFFANKISGIDFKTIIEMGGSLKIGQSYENISISKKIPKEVKNSDYYFLWKLEHKQ